MDIRKVKKLIELLEESGIAEIEIKEGEESVRISRMPTGGYAMHAPAPIMMAPQPAAPAAIAAPPEVVAKPRANEHVVTAPMVGTFYGAPAPGAKSYVELGDDVKVGQVLCIIEAMNDETRSRRTRPARSPRSWRMSGDPVEFGQPLFVIE